MTTSNDVIEAISDPARLRVKVTDIVASCVKSVHGDETYIRRWNEKNISVTDAWGPDSKTGFLAPAGRLSRDAKVELTQGTSDCANEM